MKVGSKTNISKSVNRATGGTHNAVDCHPRRGSSALFATGAVCTENLIRVDDVMESPKLVE
jgi:hypothetical protein